MAGPSGTKGPAPCELDKTGSSAETAARTEDLQRQRFARALTRSVFGRHYWDDALEAEKQRASRKTKASKAK